MDTSHVPKLFWHSLSFAVFALTIGLIWFGHKSSSVSVEIADIKIGLSQTVNETERINTDLEKKAEALVEAKAALEAEVARLNQELTNSGRTTGGVALSKPKLEQIKVPKEALDRNQRRLDSIKDRLLDVRQGAPPNP